ncbi:MAG: hypothetical protein KAG37_11730 [Flavobacteriales bacterium]|nr:hypothetical protein [Flavobacteriales bacterium]
MKKILISLFAGLLLMSSCEKRDLTISTDVKFVEFDASSFSIKENSTELLKIPVYLTTADKGLKTEVTFDIYGIGDNKAIEGVDYTLVDPNKKYIINGTVVYDTILIKLIDNSVIDRDKMLQIDIKTADNGVKIGLDRPSAIVTIIDDEHPLAQFFGEYTVTAKSYYNGDVSWVSQIVAVPGKSDELDIVNLWITDPELNNIRVKVSEDNLVLTMYGGQVLFNHVDYGDALVLKLPSKNPSENIIGANEDGTLTFNNWSISVNAGDFDAFQSTTWTK